jgi:hypothetical protein
MSLLLREVDRAARGAAPPAVVPRSRYFFGFFSTRIAIASV